MPSCLSIGVHIVVCVDVLGGEKNHFSAPSALAHRNHFEKREGMKVGGGMFKNPTTILMVLSMVLMLFLPKMMANLDPEQLEVSVLSIPSRADCCSFGDAQRVA